MHRDHIWFFEKTAKESTEFIPLASFKPRDFENFQKAYLSGRYGGVPYVKELFDVENRNSINFLKNRKRISSWFRS